MKKEKDIRQKVTVKLTTSGDLKERDINFRKTNNGGSYEVQRRRKKRTADYAD